MILAATLLILDMFGLQVARISDVTKDGVDELVVTDPCGEGKNPRDPRVLIVDPTNWSIVRVLAAEKGELEFGSLISVARSKERSFIAIASLPSGQAGKRIRLLESPSFEQLWVDDELDIGRRVSAWGFEMLCIVEAGAPSVLALAAFEPNEFEATQFKLLRRTTKTCSVVCAFASRVPRAGAHNMCPHFDEKGALEGLFVSSITGYSPPDNRYVYLKHSQLHWLALRAGDIRPISPELGKGSAAGLVMLASSANHGRFSCEAVSVRRLEQGGGQLLLLSDENSDARLDLPNDSEYWGTSMCWLRDVDGDGFEDLAIGCPTKFDGEVLIVGSKTGSAIVTVKPPPDGTPGFPEAWTYAPSFGTQVSPIADQDGDGKEDLVVAATAHGGAISYPAALSIVSTKSWKLIRVVFERDLIRQSSPK